MQITLSQGNPTYYTTFMQTLQVFCTTKETDPDFPRPENIKILKEINFHVSSAEIVSRRTVPEEEVDLDGGVAYKSPGVGRLCHAVDIASVGGTDIHDGSVGNLTGVDGDVSQLCRLADSGGVAVFGTIGGGHCGDALGIV